MLISLCFLGCSTTKSVVPTTDVLVDETQILIHKGVPENTTSRLITRLNQGNDAIDFLLRFYAARALGSSTAEGAAIALAQRLRIERDFDVRREIVCSLGKLKATDSKAQLLTILANAKEDPSVRRATMLALTDFGDPTLIAAISAAPTNDWYLESVQKQVLQRLHQIELEKVIAAK